MATNKESNRIEPGDQVILGHDIYLRPNLRLPAGIHLIVETVTRQSLWLHVQPTMLAVRVTPADVKLYRKRYV